MKTNEIYSIMYQNYTWVVINNITGKYIVCFPSQILATNWIKNKIK